MFPDPFFLLPGIIIIILVASLHPLCAEVNLSTGQKTPENVHHPSVLSRSNYYNESGRLMYISIYVALKFQMLMSGAVNVCAYNFEGSKNMGV